MAYKQLRAFSRLDNIETQNSREQKVITNKQPTDCSQMALYEGNTEGHRKEEVSMY